MNIKEFKDKLDNRELWRDNSDETIFAASSWQREANKNSTIMRWGWDCSLKLDYDGEVCSINSRFYPPHKNSADYGKYSGDISVMIGNECLNNHSIEATTLDELQEAAENHVSQILEKIHNAIKTVF